ncbi:hypothetical protein BAE44_0020527 [Dichanthelium oligosanthes]|uniref:FBD domain-containing protein n=1 Tax=Dichanthelium oligosanthes TaxID=888268 RepID=A0A1E5V089_9POAL|nr:hypothetical protein BAE44_0020527 [Dichanthelium oligosanthes]
MTAYTAALTSLLATQSSPSSNRVAINHLRLSFYLTDPYLSHIGHAVGEVVEYGITTDLLELAICADVHDPSYEQCVVFGQRFMTFVQACPVAFRWLTRLILQNLTFGDSDISSALNACNKLELLSLTYCVCVIDPVTGEDTVLTIDAPNSSLLALEITTCAYERIDLIQAPKLGRLLCTNWIAYIHLTMFYFMKLSCHPCERSICEDSAQQVNVHASPDFKHLRLSMLEMVGFAVEEKLMKYLRLVMKRAVGLRRICLFDQQPCAKCDTMDNAQSPSSIRWRFPTGDDERKLIRQQLVDGFSSSAEISIV